ncbi:MAG TPA: two-component regulator propeller domain-containing protein, partial [Saprospiraceae bacterium]|nr:two-component regulator propeller domain-containing protein [Saprospiraceae bacterium]
MHSLVIIPPTHFIRVFSAVLFIIFSQCNNCTAQSPYPNFEHITTEHGLSSNKIEAILQDRDGLYWIATKNGLNRFDGTNFKIYLNDPEDSTSLTHNNCTYLLEDINGDIWVATYKGVSRFIKNRGVFQPIYFHHPLKNFEVSNRIYKIASDLEGNVWISGNGLWKYNIKTQEVAFMSINNSGITSISDHGLILELWFDKINNGFWLTTGLQLNFYSIVESVFYHSLHNPRHWKVFDAASPHEISLDDKDRLWYREKENMELCYFDSKSNEVTKTGKKLPSGCRQIKAGPKNRIWLSYWGSGSEIYDPVTNTSDSLFFKPRHRYSLLDAKSRLMCVDKQNNYWVAANNGINVYNEANQYYEWHSLKNSQSNGTSSSSIKAIEKGPGSKLWIATKIGLYEYDLLDHSSRQINQIKDIRSLTVDDDHLWMAIKDQILQMDVQSETIDKKIDLQKDIIFVEKGNDHDLWVGIWTGGLYNIDLITYDIQHFTKNEDANSLKSNSLICKLVDGENFWIGYNVGNGFSKYSTSEKKFTHYHPEEKAMSNSSAGTINVITKDQNGNFWIGTHGSGIFRFDQQTNTYQNFQQHNGLKSNYVNSILPDFQNNLWISTSDGINYFNEKRQAIIPIEIDLALEGNDFVQNGLASDNKLYFFNESEIVEIDPAAYQQALNFPQLVISSFKVFDEEFPFYGQPRDIRLSYEENFFTIQFSSIKAHPLKKVRYAYKLEGFDKEWIESGIQQKASYTNVPHGEYTFKIKATNDAGEWSDVLLSSVIRITPPFWQTWWFVLLCVCV